MTLIFLVSCSNKLSVSEIPMPEKYKEMYDLEQRLAVHNAWAKVDPWVFKIELHGNDRDTLEYAALISPNLLIRDLFTNDEIINVYNNNNPSDIEKFAIYSLENWSNGTRHLLIYSKGKFSVIQTDNLPKALKEIISYFKRNPKVDERFRPICVQEIINLFLYNTQFDQFGPWRHWWGEEADSLGRIYNKYMKYH